jgi:hypothetical protein
MALALVVAGTALRLFLAIRYEGVAIDIGAWMSVAIALQHDPLHVYRQVNGDPSVRYVILIWPNPAGFFPFIRLAAFLTHHVGWTFSGWIKLPAIAADAGIAWLIYNRVRATVSDVAAQVSSVALVALGPSFWVSSGYHGQFEAVAVLPALAAVLLWSARDHDRALFCGLLIGMAAAIRVPGIFLLLALLPTARGWREAASVTAPALMLPAIVTLPFFIADPAAVLGLSHIQVQSGLAGLSLLVQPAFLNNFLQTGSVQPSPALLFMQHHGDLLTLAGLLCVSPLLFWRRVPAIDAAVIIWLTVYVFAGAILFHYLLWGIPLFILAHRRAAAAFLAVMCIPLAITYLEWHSATSVLIFQVVMIGLYLAAVAAWAKLCVERYRQQPLSAQRPGKPQRIRST